MRVNDQLRKCVFFVGQKSRDGFGPVGTAFLVASDTMGRRFDHIVTARHNLEMIWGDTIFLRVNKKDGGAETIPTPRADWQFIPDGTNGRYIDVAVLPVYGIAIDGDTLDVINLPLGGVVHDAASAERAGLMAGAPVVAMGLFTSHYGEAHNIPIVRQGHIATMRDPDNPVPTTRGDMDAYLVEMRSLGGLSGSPVLQAIEPFWFEANQKRQPEQLKPFYLLGLVQGHYVTKVHHDIVWPPKVRPPGDSSKEASASDDDFSPDEYNAGIGIVVPVSYIIDTINQDHLVEKRKAIVEQQRKDSGAREDVGTPPASEEASSQ